MSEPRAAYDVILTDLGNEITDVERKIFDALKKNRNGLNRQQLVAIVFGESVRAGAASNNNTKDRKVRLAIASLRARMVPITSSSGEAGYRLDTSRESRERMVADLISRRNKLNDLINHMAKAYNMPEHYQPAEIASQARLI